MRLVPAQVVLDRLRPEDAPQIARALSDWQVTRWLAGAPWPYGTDDARDFVAGAGSAVLAIRVSTRFAGVIRVGRDPGLWLSRDEQCAGVGLRASVLGLSRAFAGGAPQLRARHAAGNHRAALLLARLGFRPVRNGARMRRADEALSDAVCQLTLGRGGFAARHGVSLDTARLRLEAVRPGDLSALRDLATDPRVAPMLLRFHPAMTAEAFAAQFPPQALVPPFRLVARRHGGRVAGSVGIGTDAGSGAPIWYFVAPDLAGGGLASEMLAAFLAEIDARYAPPLLRAEVFQDNPASRRVLEKCGFAVTGTAKLSSAARTGPALAWQMQRAAP